MISLHSTVNVCTGEEHVDKTNEYELFCKSSCTGSADCIFWWSYWSVVARHDAWGHGDYCCTVYVKSTGLPVRGTRQEDRKTWSWWVGRTGRTEGCKIKPKMSWTNNKTDLKVCVIVDNLTNFFVVRKKFQNPRAYESFMASVMMRFWPDRRNWERSSMMEIPQDRLVK